MATPTRWGPLAERDWFRGRETSFFTSFFFIIPGISPCFFALLFLIRQHFILLFILASVSRWVSVLFHLNKRITLLRRGKRVPVSGLSMIDDEKERVKELT